MNGFAEQLKKWNEQFMISINRLTSIESDITKLRKKAEEPLPWWKKLIFWSPSSYWKTASALTGRTLLPPHTPEFWVAAPIEEKLQEESVALTDYNRAAWFSLLYSATPDDLRKAGITSFDDYLRKHPPEAGTAPSDLSKAYDYVESMLAPPAAPTAPGEAPVEEFLTQPLETRPRFKGVHITTVEEMTKWLKREIHIPKLPPGITEGAFLDYLRKERGLSDEELADIDASISDWTQKIEEYEAGREQIARYKAGLETPEMPELTIGEKAKLIALQPALVLMDIIQPYWTYWDYPRSAILTKLVFDFPLKPPWITKPPPEAEEEMAELKQLYKANREAGMDYWMANSKAWQDWSISSWAKMGIEIVSDPLSYLGFGILIKLARTTKGIPVMGKVMSGLGSFERGFIATTEAPFTLLKSTLVKLPKTTGQHAALAAAETRNTIAAIHGRAASSMGKTLRQVTQDDFAKLNREAIAHALASPDAVDPLAQLGWSYVKRTPITHTDLLEWGGKVGSTLNLDDITPGMVEGLEHMIEHTVIKGGKFKVINLDVTVQKVLREILEAADSPENMKTIKGLIEGVYGKTIDDALAMAKLPVEDSIKAASGRIEAIVFSKAREKIFFKRLHQGFVAGIMNNVLDPLKTQIWRNGLDKHLIMPFARAYLITGSYAPWNWFEEVFRTVFGRGGFVYGKNTPARLEGIASGLMLDREVLRGTALAKMTYKEILRKRLVKPGAAPGVGELSEAALLKETEEAVGKVPLEKLLLLGWLPGGKGRAIHEAMYFPIRASQWAGGMQRAGYTMRRFLDNLDDIAPNAMASLRKAKPPTPPDFPAGFPGRAKKAFAQKCDDNAIVGPTMVENTPKSFGMKETSLAEAHDASLKYTELGDTRDFILSHIEAGDWDIPTIAGGAKVMLADGLINSPEGSRIFLKNITDDLMKGAEKITTPEELMAYTQALREISTITPETISKLFTGLHAKASRAHSSVRAGIYTEGYKNIAPFIDEGEKQAQRLFEFIQANKAILSADKIIELDKNLSVYMGRIIAIQNTRRQAVAKSEELISEGIRAGTPKFYEEMNLVWDNYFRNIDPELFARQLVMAEGIDALMTPRNIQKPIINASVRGLTPADVAALHYGTGDQLAYALMNSEALMRKEYFVAATKLRADDMALRANTTRDALGFTDDAIGQVYDQVVHGLRSSPEFHNLLTRPYAELDNYARDLESIKLANSASLDAMKSMDDYATAYANNLRELNIYKPTVPAKPPPVKPPVKVKPGALTAEEAAYMNSKLPGHNFKAGETLREAMAREGYEYPALPTSWEPTLEKMPGRVVSEETKLIKQIDGLDDQLANVTEAIEKAESAGKPTIDLKAKSAKIENQLWELEKKLEALPVVAKAIEKAPTKPIAKLPGEGSDDWWRIKQEAMDKTMISYHQDFTDYTNMNALDAGVRYVFPYWVYESQRWFWLPRNFVTHPGVLNAWGKYMDNSDFGYIHMPGTSLDINVLRGTVYKGGMSTLVRRDYPEYYDRAFPELFETMDYAQRLGFFPNIFWSIPVTMYGGREPQLGQLLPAVVRTPLDLYVAANPGSGLAKALQDVLFPDYFRQYLQIAQANHMASTDQIQRDINGVYIWEKMQRKEELTPEEQELWDVARGKVSSYSPLLQHAGIFRMRHEDRIKAYDWWGKFLEEKTGVSVEMQEDLRRHGMSIGDVCPGLSQLDTAQIEEALEYRRWIAPRVTAPLRPSNEIEVNLVLSEFWGMVRRHGEESRGAISELEVQAFTERSISAEDYVTRVRAIMEDNANYIHKLRGDKFDIATGQWEANPQSRSKFRIVPVTLDERATFYAERGVNLSMSTLDEMLAMWYSMSPREKIDPETGVRYVDWGTYFATMDAIEGVLPDNLKGEWQSFMSRNTTPGWLMHRNTTKQYLVPYWNTTNVIKKQFSPEEQDLIDEYYMVRDINPTRAQEIQDITRPNGLKLISQYQSAVTNARKRLRMAIPMVDAQLLFWGRTTTLLTPEAEALYNQLVLQARGIAGS